MRIEDLKRWHWIVIGTIVGLALGYLYSSLEPSVPRSIAQQTFERDLLRKLDSGHTVLSDIVVYPPKEGVAVVTGRQLDRVRGSRDEWEPKPFSLWVRHPYKPQQNGPENPEPNMTVQDYLAHVASQHDHVTYRYAWWRETKATYAISVLGAVALIGGVWPTVVSLLVGAGFGRKSAPEPDYDLSRFGQGEEASRQPEKKEMSQEEYDQLKAVEAELEQKLKSGELGASGQGGSGAEAPPTIRQLSGGPLEGNTMEQQEEGKDYAGEFYPTVAHAPKRKPDGTAHDGGE